MEKYSVKLISTIKIIKDESNMVIRLTSSKEQELKFINDKIGIVEV